MSQYEVNLWGSHPREKQDDCITGVVYDTLEQAMKTFCEPIREFALRTLKYTAYIELKSDDYYCVRENPAFVPKVKEERDAEWDREIAMQAGMAHGVNAYNDAMGWDCHSPEEEP